MTSWWDRLFRMSASMTVSTLSCPCRMQMAAGPRMRARAHTLFWRCVPLCTSQPVLPMSLCKSNQQGTCCKRYTPYEADVEIFSQAECPARKLKCSIQWTGAPHADDQPIRNLWGHPDRLLLLGAELNVHRCPCQIWQEVPWSPGRRDQQF